MNVEPCNVCGSTDVNLVDGFYYCVECGTQDVNVRETVIEERALADGTFTIRRHNKVTIAAEETQELSGEWHKWHTYNFVLSGLADELIAAGAKPSFKMKLLWLWTKYIKQFQNKEELGLTKNCEEETIQHEATQSDDEESSNSVTKTKKTKAPYRALKMTTDLSVVKKGLICSLIYAALNLDGSDIQLSCLLRFIREGRLDINNCLKYVPQEIKFRLVPQWETFSKSKVTVQYMNITSLAIFKCLNLLPVLPDLRLIVDRFIKELCLPKEFKNLVFSLMDLVPCDIFLEIDRSIINSLLRIPPYECTIMGYFLVAFKMCFGLDDHYEVILSDAVDKVNDENCHLKSYKLGDYSEPTDRLFSFRDWCSFIQLRKIILCKYYLHMAEQYALDIDDYVYMEQCERRKKDREPLLSDEITMNLLDKIPQISSAEVIPKSEFKATLTPLSTYTDLVLQYFKDPDLRLLFSEDFSQYSLKYACEKLRLGYEEDLKNLILGIDDTKKIINKEIYGRLKETSHDGKMVYVRNCENKNWLKTNQPSVEHVQKINKSNSDRESDHGYDSNTENAPEIEISSKDEESSNHDSVVYPEDNIEVERKLEIIEEEDADKNIFDDKFENLVFVEDSNILNDVEIKVEEPKEEYDEDHIDHHDFDTFNDEPLLYHEDDKTILSHNDSDLFFNPDTFDRSKTIKELILATCTKYKIKIPNEYNTKEPVKRKSKFINDTAGESHAKRRKVEDGGPKRKISKRGEATEEIHKLLLDYYSYLQNDVMLQISEHVKNVVNNANQTREDGIDINDEIEIGRAEGDINLANQIENRDITVPDGHDENIDVADGIDVDNTSLDQSSLQIIDNDDGDDENNQPKVDPRFDEKEYDIKQLYVKVDGEEESDSDDLFGIDKDPELIAILDKKIEEAVKGEISSSQSQEISAPCAKEKSYDSDDDDLPLSVLKEELDAIQQKSSNDHWPKLILNQEHITEFKYWTRFYASKKMSRLYELNEPFDLELQENFPVSFMFVIRECAGIIDCSPYQLYKSMIALEQRILSHNR